MPDFQGTKSIILQPGDVKVPYSFQWTVCSCSTGNDGSIPFGHSISTGVTAAHREDGISMSTAIVAGSSWTGNVATILLSFPSSTGALMGKYHLTFTATISDGTTTYSKEFDFNRIMVRNL